MHRYIFISILFLFVHSCSNNISSDSRDVTNVEINGNQFISVDPLKAIEEEIIKNPNSTNVYLKEHYTIKIKENSVKQSKTLIGH